VDRYPTLPVKPQITSVPDQKANDGTSYPSDPVLGALRTLINMHRLRQVVLERLRDLRSKVNTCQQQNATVIDAALRSKQEELKRTQDAVDQKKLELQQLQTQVTAVDTKRVKQTVEVAQASSFTNPSPPQPTTDVPIAVFEKLNKKHKRAETAYKQKIQQMEAQHQQMQTELAQTRKQMNKTSKNATVNPRQLTECQDELKAASVVHNQELGECKSNYQRCMKASKNISQQLQKLQSVQQEYEECKRNRTELLTQVREAKKKRHQTSGQAEARVEALEIELENVTEKAAQLLTDLKARAEKAERRVKKLEKHKTVLEDQLLQEGWI